MFYVLAPICIVALFQMFVTSDSCCTYSLLSLETPAIVLCGCMAISRVFLTRERFRKVWFLVG